MLKFAFLITLNLDNKMDPTMIFLAIAFTSNKRSFHFVLVEIRFSTTFSPIGSVHVLWGIVLARDLMLMDSVVNGCRIVSLVNLSPFSHGYGISGLLWHKLLVYKFPLQTHHEWFTMLYNTTSILPDMITLHHVSITCTP